LAVTQEKHKNFLVPAARQLILRDRPGKLSIVISFADEQELRLKIFIILALTMLSACSWFHAKAPHAPDPPVFVVTGAPAGSIVFIDDVQKGQAAEFRKPQMVSSVEGTHKVEVRFGDTVVYREDIYIKGGERRVVTVLSGSNRE
jgi:hypothetical protein